MDKKNIKTKLDRPKILVVSQHFWPEAFRINDICDYLLEKCRIDVLCGIPNYPRGHFYDNYGLFKNRTQKHKSMTLYRSFEFPRGKNTNTRIFLNYMSFPISSLFHIPRLLTHKYDKIFLYQTSPVYMSLAGILIGKLKKTERILYVLDLWPENLYSVLNVKSRFLRKIAKSTSHWHYRNCDKLIAVSQKMKAQLHEITNLPDEKIVFIPQSCEKIYEEDVYDKKLQDKFPPGFNIVFAGNISPAQDFETIVGAAKKLIENGIKNINWIIIGDGMSRKWLEKKITEEDLSDSFFFEGFRPITDMPKYHTLADGLIACLTKSDLLDCTIPAKVMSYFAAGRPILLAMDGEAQELVNNVGCGFAGPSSDMDKLYENIKKLYDTSLEERKKMGAKGREYHFKHFERNMNMKKLYDFIFS